MNNKCYKCEINNGYSTSGSTTECAYTKTTIKLESKNVISLGNSDHNRIHVEFNRIKKTIFNITLTFFLFFFLLSLGFNLIFYLLVPQSGTNLIAPKILLAIFLLVGIIPIIVNLKTINRKIRIDYDTSKFSRVIFESKADRDSFLNQLALSVSSLDGSTKKDYYADVSYDNVSLNYAKLSIISKNCVAVKTKESNEEFSFYRKNRGTIWFLYIFFGIFLSAPIALISTSLMNGTFEKGMLATLLFGFVGLVGMFVPSVLSRGNLYLYCGDKSVLLKFCDSKTRNQFNHELNKAPKYRNRIIKNSIETYRVDCSKKYEILDENPRLSDYGAAITIFAVSALLLSGAIAMLITQVEIIGAIVMFVMFLLFFTLAMFVSKTNIIIIKSRIRRKKTVKMGNVVVGEIVSCATKTFTFKKAVVYDVELIISYVSEHGQSLTKYIHRKFDNDKQFALGQKLFICEYLGLYLALQCSLLNQNALSDKIAEDNHVLSLSNLQQEDEFDIKLKTQKARAIKFNDKAKPFEKSVRIRDFFALICILPFLFLIIYIGVKVITHNPDDQTQITLAIIFLAIFGGTLGYVGIFSIVNLILRIRRNVKIKAFIKRANITHGYITDIDKYVWYVRSGENGRVPKVRYLINYKYKDNNGRIIKKSYRQSDYLYFSNSYYVGEEIIVYYDYNDSLPMKKLEN